MTTVERISVAEQGYESDRIAMKQFTTRYHVNTDTTYRKEIIFEITDNQNLIITCKQDGLSSGHGRHPVTSTISRFEFDKLNLNELIKFLEEAKEFVSESIVVKKLKGQ